MPTPNKPHYRLHVHLDERARPTWWVTFGYWAQGKRRTVSSGGYNSSANANAVAAARNL